jgi:peptidoglycan hydrolase-like protein with peptidoglycan-binding domain
MKASRNLVYAGAVSVVVLVAGCAMTGAVPPSRANGEATAPNTRLRSSAPVDTNVVVAAQRALVRYGYDPGQTDGVYTASTKEAVMQFQQARGLRQTGELDSQTVSALGVGR